MRGDCEGEGSGGGRVFYHTSSDPTPPVLSDGEGDLIIPYRPKPFHLKRASVKN